MSIQTLAWDGTCEPTVSWWDRWQCNDWNVHEPTQRALDGVGGVGKLPVHLNADDTVDL